MAGHLLPDGRTKWSQTPVTLPLDPSLDDACVRLWIYLDHETHKPGGKGVAGVTAIATALQWSKTKAHKHLSHLLAAGQVEAHSGAGQGGRIRYRLAHNPSRRRAAEPFRYANTSPPEPFRQGNGTVPPRERFEHESPSPVSEGMSPAQPAAYEGGPVEYHSDRVARLDDEAWPA